MKSISERLDEIVEERKKFHFIETVHERKSGVIEERRSGVIKWNQTSSLIIEPKVYGREKDKDQIVNFFVGMLLNLRIYQYIEL